MGKRSATIACSPFQAKHVGHINNQLIALGVSVTHLIQLMQSAYSATSSIGGLTAANVDHASFVIDPGSMSAIQSQLEQMISRRSAI